MVASRVLTTRSALENCFSSSSISSWLFLAFRLCLSFSSADLPLRPLRKATYQRTITKGYKKSARFTSKQFLSNKPSSGNKELNACAMCCSRLAFAAQSGYSGMSVRLFRDVCQAIQGCLSCYSGMSVRLFRDVCQAIQGCLLGYSGMSVRLFRDVCQAIQGCLSGYSGMSVRLFRDVC
ncbi:hypothetical protein DPMN_131248 [Dreissena polymorpha]|uniref:Uncharacterized protein n=1 Tax=Dreissena polymorpha TaxID=45954 RepID=A0A9D4H494_DREPO|nr:hypothetical protein DPMN_131248 [Dreissena polymorpha]